MSIQQSGYEYASPEYGVDARSGDSLREASRDRHLVLVPQLAEITTAPNQPDTSTAVTQGLDVVTPTKIIAREYDSPMPLDEKSKLSALYIGTTAAGPCYRVPRESNGR